MKHAVLVAVLDELLVCLSPSGTLTVCDAFAGNGAHTLVGPGEWTRGIGAFAKAYNTAQFSLPRIDAFLAACWSLSPNPKTYPGSSVIAADRALTATRSISIQAWDTDPACVNNLKQVLKGQGHVQLQATTGSMPAGAAVGVDLLFVDPPQRKGWETVVAKLAPKVSGPKALVIWLPVNGKKTPSSWIPTTTVSVLSGMMGPLWSVEVLWGVARSAQPMVGCELLMVLPPRALRAAVEAAAEVVQTMGKPWSVKLRQL